MLPTVCTPQTPNIHLILSGISDIHRVDPGGSEPLPATAHLHSTPYPPVHE